MYLGRVGLGLVIFFVTLYGYAFYIFPGLVIQFLSAVAAAASVPATPPETKTPPPRPGA